MNSELSIANLVKVQSTSGDESLEDLDSSSYTHDVATEYSYFYKGLGELKKWSDLPEILEKDCQKVVLPKGNGLCLIKSISESLRLQYDICMDPERFIQLI